MIATMILENLSRKQNIVLMDCIPVSFSNSTNGRGLIFNYASATFENNPNGRQGQLDETEKKGKNNKT